MPAHGMCVGHPIKTEYYKIEPHKIESNVYVTTFPIKKIVVSIN
jgi:hypothetical protein